MRLVAVAAVATFLATGIHADTHENCAAAWKTMPAVDRGDMTLKEWSAKCLKPAYWIGEYGAPSYTIAICKDGHFSRRKNPPHRCAHHGGVQTWLQ